MDRTGGPLTTLLERLEDALRRQRSPLVDRLAPPANAGSLQAAVGQTLRLPAEVLEWWSWHDGAPGTYSESPDYALGGTWVLLSFREAVDHYHFSRDVAQSLTEPGITIDDWWPWSWLPLARRSNGDVIVVDCGTEEQGRVMLFQQGVPELISARQPALASLVQVWLSALAAGAWRYERPGWRREPNEFGGSANDRRFL